MNCAALSLAFLVCVAGCGGEPRAACAPRGPDRVTTGEPTPVDLGEVLPRARLDPLDERPARAWGDLDGDGDDELLVDGPDGTIRTEPGGVVVPEELTFVWPDDLDGRRGEDVVVPDRASGTTAVWSGRSILAGDADVRRPDRRLRGLPRAVARLRDGGERETLLLVPGRPAVRFVDPVRPELRLGGAPASEVEQVVVFEGEDGERRIGLRVDRRFAEWRVPDPC